MPSFTNVAPTAGSIPVTQESELARRTKSLPSHAQAIIKATRERSEVREAEFSATWDILNRKNARLSDLKSVIAHAERDLERGSVKETAESKALLAEQKAQAEEMTREIASIRLKIDSRPAGISPDVFDEWLAEMKVTKIREAIPNDEQGAEKVIETRYPVYRDARVSVAPRKGQSDADGLEDAKAKLLSLRTEKKRTKAAPLSLEEGEQRLVKTIKRKAAKGAPDFSGPLQFRPIRLDGPPVQGDVRFPFEGMPADKRAEALGDFVTWLFADQIIERGREELKRLHDPSRALSVEARAARLVELDAAILAAERVVEAWASRCEAAGLVVNRNWLSSVPAILGIAPVEESEFG